MVKSHVHVPYVGGESRVDSVDRRLTVRKEAIEVYKFHLKRALDRMKSQADKHRTDRDVSKSRSVKEMQRRSLYIGSYTHVCLWKRCKLVNPFCKSGLKNVYEGNVAVVVCACSVDKRSK
ncbi:hypothetical protein Tco_0396191 [Tanacetum coccineum]